MSLKAQRSLSDATGNVSRVYERLSSGQRINRASDDAAGLAISDSLSSKSRIYSQSIRNLSDGVSVLAIANGSLGQLTGVVTRMRELAEQSANGTFANGQRLSLDAEAQALAKEFNRIVATTSFNGLTLFDANSSGIRLQLGDTSANGGIFIRTGNTGVGRRGDGTFQSGSAGNVSAYTATSADFNSDGILDIISSSGGNLEISIGNGDGTFRAKTTQQILTSGSIVDFVIGDFNGDGNKDVIVGGVSGIGGLLLGNGNGTFSTFATISGAFMTYLGGGDVGDINNDGIDDLLTGGSVFLGQSSGSMKLTTTYESNVDSLYDMNGDGKLDILVGGSESIKILYGNGNGTFTSAQTLDLSTALSGSEFYQIRGGDINGDGKADIVAHDVSTGFLQILLGNGDGTFSIGTSIDTGGASFFNFGRRNIALRDLNEDGKDDLVFTDLYVGDLQYAFGLADGSFSSIKTLSTAGDYAFTFGDFNGDGALDIYGSGNGTTSRTYLANAVSTSTLDTFSLKTRSDALISLNILQNSFDRLSQARSFIGSDESRVNAAQKVMGILRENYIAANNRIIDADVAQESAELIKLQILQKAGASILAQANVQPSLALTLLN